MTREKFSKNRAEVETRTVLLYIYPRRRVSNHDDDRLPACDRNQRETSRREVVRGRCQCTIERFRRQRFPRTRRGRHVFVKTS